MFSYIWDKVYCHGSSNMLSLPFPLMLAKFLAPSRDTTCASKTLKSVLPWESTISTYGLSKILQVSCHRCKKAIKMASKSVRSFSVRENWALHELVMVKNKSDRLHNTGRYHKGQCNMTFFCAKRLSIQTNKRMATSASLCEGPIFYFYVFTFMQRVKSFPSIPSYFLFWQASCGEERSRHICPVEYG